MRYARARLLPSGAWNKGPLLEQTLRALVQTEIGNNSVFVLLNG
jgi:hypothetical protein